MVAAAPAMRGFNCGNCGAAVELRALYHSRSVACTSCGAILDPSDPNVFVLQKAKLKEAITPDIPLGSRGTWHGHPWEVIGFQRRSIEVDGTRYSWDEYLLFNPYRGFRYLSNYEGHWNDIRTIREIPLDVTTSRRPKVRHNDVEYEHFQAATARTDFVLGEFPWRVRVGDTVEASDYIAPPLMLSSERTDEETTWSQGVYTDAAEIWQAFSVSGTPFPPSGVFANQPSPYPQRYRGLNLVFLLLAGVLLLLFVGRVMTADREQVFTGQYIFQPGSPEPAFVTDQFALREAGTVQIRVRAQVLQSWLGFDIALINVESGSAWNVSREASFYSGSDSDGPWTEDERQQEILLPRVPAGQYYLRVEPEGESTGRQVSISIQVRRDVPTYLPYVIAFVLLIVPPIRASLRSAAFEQRRLAEGDYGA